MTMWGPLLTLATSRWLASNTGVHAEQQLPIDPTSDAFSSTASSSSATPSSLLCVSVAFFAVGDRPVPALDSVRGLDELRDFSWVLEHCASSPPVASPPHVVDGVQQAAAYDSGWVTVSPPPTALEVAEIPVTATGVECRRIINATAISAVPSAEASTDSDNLLLVSLDVACTCRATIAGTTASGKTFTVPWEVDVRKHVHFALPAVPLNETSSLPVPWSGAMSTTTPAMAAAGADEWEVTNVHDDGAGAVSIMDPDVFDGQPGTVLTNAAGQAANETLVSVAAAVRNVVSDLAYILSPVPSSSSSVPASIRGTTLSANAFQSGTAVTTISRAGSLVVGHQSADVAGVLVLSEVSCSGSGCPTTLVFSLQNLLSAGINTTTGAWASAASSGSQVSDCSRPQVVTDSLKSDLATTIFVSDNEVRVLSVVGTTTALLHCTAQDVSSKAELNWNAGVSIKMVAAPPLPSEATSSPATAGKSTSAWAAWPSREFLHDSLTALNLAKSLSVSPSAFVYGTLPRPAETAHRTRSLLRADLFGSSRGGVLVDDVPLSAATVDAIFEKIRAAFSTGVTAVDRFINSAILPSNTSVPQLLYKSSCSYNQPTLLGFLQFWATVTPGINVFADSDGSSWVFELAASSIQPAGTAVQSPLSLSDVSIAAAAAAQTELGTAVVAAVPADLRSRYNVPQVETVAQVIQGGRIALQVTGAVRVTGVILGNYGVEVIRPGVAEGTIRVPFVFGSMVGNRTNVLRGANCTYDIGIKAAACVGMLATALVPAQVPSGRVRLSRDSPAALEYDSLLPVPISSLSASFEHVGASVAALNFTTRSLGELDLWVGTICGSHGAGPSWANVLSTASTSSVGDAPSMFALEDALEVSLLELQCFGALQDDSFGSGLGGAAVQVHFTSGVGRIEGSVKVSSLRAVGVLANYTTLSSSVGVSRLNMPLVLSTTVSFSLASSASASGVETFEVLGSGRSSGFVVPVLQNMKWATTTNGTAVVYVNLPQAACFNLTLETLTDFGTTGTISANDDLTPSTGIRDERDLVPWFATQMSSLTVSQLLAQQKDVQASSGNFGVEPRQLLTMLRSGALQLLPMLLQRGLSVPLPLSESMSQQEAFGARLQNYTEAVSTLEAWLQFPGVPTTSVAVAQSHSTFCAGSLSTSVIEFTVSVNEHDTTTCSLPADTSRATCTMSKLATQLSVALASCGFRGLFEVNATATSSDGMCGGLAIFPAVPNLLRTVQINASDLEMRESSYTLPALASFGTWHDLNQLLLLWSAQQSDPMSAGMVQAQRGSVTVADTPGLVPPSLVAVYPSELPTVSVTVQVSGTDSFIQAGTLQLDSSGGVAIALNQTVAASTLSSTSKMKFGAAFDAGVTSSITLYTAFEGTSASSFNTSVVSPVPNNTFTLQIVAQERSADGVVVPLNLQGVISLTPGKLLSEAILTELPIQAAKLGSAGTTLAASILPARSIDGRAAQVNISVVPVQVAGSAVETWVVPVSLRIMDSTIPEVCGVSSSSTCSNDAATTAVLATDVHLSCQYNSDVTWGSVDGRVGVVAVASGAASEISEKVGGTVDVSLNISCSGSSTVSTLFSAAVKNLSYFAVGADVQSSLVIPSITAHLPTPQATLASGSTRGLTPTLELAQRGLLPQSLRVEAKNITDLMMAWFHEFTDPESDAVKLFDGLATLTGETFCEWMRLVEEHSASIGENTTDPSLESSLPFVSGDFKGLWTAGAGSVAEAVAELVCGSTHHTVTAFLAGISASVTGDLSTAASLQNLTLVIDVALSISDAGSWALHFDPATWLDIGHSRIPLGLGEAGDISVSATTALKARLVADFAGSTPRIFISTDPSTTAFTIDAELSACSNTKVYFGPLSIDLVNIDLALKPPDGSRAIFAATLSNVGALQIAIAGSASLQAAVTLPSATPCTLSVQVGDIGTFLNGQSKPSVDTGGCQNLVQELESALNSNLFFKFFQSPHRVVAMMGSGMQGFIGRLFGANGLIAQEALPLLDKELEKVLTKELTGVLGPAATNALVAGVTKITNDIILKHNASLTEVEVDQLLLTEFTLLLCDVLGPVLVPGSCPATPTASHTPYHWPLRFGRSVKKPIANLGFGLAAHGIASLGVECELDLVADWGLNVTLAYGTSSGISVNFTNPAWPAFSADVGIVVAPGVPCEVSGTIGFLGADIVLDSSTEARAVAAVMKRSDAADFHAELNVSALLQGQAELGAAGKLQGDIVDNSALEILPHFTAGLKVAWEYSTVDGQGSVPAPLLRLTKPMFCIGSFLAKLTQQTFSEINKVLKPLNDVLGQNGILTKKIQVAKYVFGKPMNLIQIAETFCQSSCVFEDVIEALEVLSNFDTTLEAVTSMADGMDIAGCNVWQMQRNFTIDFSPSSTVPKITFPDDIVPPGELQFSGAAQQHEAAVTTTWSGINKTGNFGFECNMCHAVPGSIVDLLIGTNFGVVGVSFPTLTLGALATWSIPICPYANVVLNLGASVTADVGELALTSSGLIDAVRTGRPGKLFGAIGYPTKNVDGSFHYPLQAQGTLGGGLEIHVGFILEIQLEGGVNLQLVGQVGFVDPYGDGWVTFAEIFWMIDRNGGDLWSSMQRDLKLQMWVYFNVKICIDLFFKSFCKTVFHVQSSTDVLFDDKSTPTFIGKVADSSGQVNLGVVETYIMPTSAARQHRRVGLPSTSIDDDTVVERTFLFYDATGGAGTVVGYYPASSDASAGAPVPASVTIPMTNTLSYSGSPQLSFGYHVKEVTPAVQLPSQAWLVLDQAAYPSSQFVVTATSIKPSGAYGGVSIDPSAGCQRVNLSAPAMNSQVTVSSIAFPLNIDVAAGTNISFTGSPSDYREKPVHILGEASAVNVAVTATNVIVSSQSVLGSSSPPPFPSDFIVLLPPDIWTLNAGCHPTMSCNFSVFNVTDLQDVFVTGGQGDDHFTVDLASVAGSLALDGASGVNAFTLNVRATAGAAATSVTNNGIVLDTASADTSVVAFSNIQRQRYVLNAAPHSTNSFVLIKPNAGTLIRVDSVGATNSTTTHQITGCAATSEIRLNLTGAGTHLVNLGSSGSLAGFACTMRIVGGTSSTQSDRVTLFADAETRPLQWVIADNYVNVRDLTGNGGWLTIYHEELESLEVRFGSKATDVLVDGGHSTMEYGLYFLNSSVDANAHSSCSLDSNECVAQVDSLRQNHVVRIRATDSNFLINGSVRVDVDNDKTVPFESVRGMIAVATFHVCNCQPSAVVTVASPPSANGQAQYYSLTGRCLDPMDANGSAPSPVAGPSRRMCSAMVSNGFSSCAACRLAFAGAVNLTVQTGGGADYFQGVGVHDRSIITANLSAGDDTVVWAFAGAELVATFDMGPGNDNVTQLLPLGGVVNVSLGEDDDHSDVLDVWYGDAPIAPSFNGVSATSAVVAPLQPGADPTASRTLIQHLLARDQPFISAGYPAGWSTTSLSVPPMIPRYFQVKHGDTNMHNARSTQGTRLPASVKGGSEARSRALLNLLSHVQCEDRAFCAKAAEIYVHNCSSATGDKVGSVSMAQGELRLTLDSNTSGDVLVFVSSAAHSILSFGCSVRVSGASNSTVTVVVDASGAELPAASLLAPPPTSWKIDRDYLSMWAGDGAGSGPEGGWMNLYLQSVDQLILLIADTHNDVQLFHGSPGTEIIVNGVGESTGSPAPGGTNATTVQLWSTAAAVFVNGSFAPIGLSPPQSSMSTSMPFAAFNGRAFAAGVGSGSSVPAELALSASVASGAGVPTISQALELADNCLRQLNSNGSQLVPVSTRFCALLQQSGFSEAACGNACPFAFVNSIDLRVVTGAGNDTFVGTAPTENSTVDVALGGGTNNFTWSFAGDNCNASVSFGGVEDSLRVLLPCKGSVTGNLGDDSPHADTIEVFAGPEPLPSVHGGGLVAPLAAGIPSNRSFMSLHGQSARDQLSVMTGYPWGDNSIAAVYRQDGVSFERLCGGTNGSETEINITIPGELVRYSLESNGVYVVKEVASQGIAQIGGVGGASATDWVVRVSLADVAHPAFVVVYADYDSNGTLWVDVPSLVHQNGDKGDAVAWDVLISEGEGAALGQLTVGGLTIRVDHVAQLVLNVANIGIASSTTKITGSLGGADIVVLGGSSVSRVDVHGTLSANLLLSGGIASLQPQGSNTTVVVAGATAGLQLEGLDGRNPGLTVTAGCVFNRSAASGGKAHASQWFRDTATALGVNASYLSSTSSCAAVLHEAMLLNVTAQHLIATKLFGAVRTLQLAAPASVLELNGASDPLWRELSLRGLQLSVAGTGGVPILDVVVSSRTLVYVADTLLQPLSTLDSVGLNMDCCSLGPGLSDSGPAKWIFGNNATPSILNFSAPDCNVAVSKTVSPRPKINISNSMRYTCHATVGVDLGADTDLKPRTLDDGAQRGVWIGPAELAVTTATVPEEKLLVDWDAQSVSLQSLVSTWDGTNDVWLARGFYAPQVAIGTNATTQLSTFDSSASIEIVVVDRVDCCDVEYLAEHSAVYFATSPARHNGSTSLNYCFEPAETCSAAAWTVLSSQTGAIVGDTHCDDIVPGPNTSSVAVQAILSGSYIHCSVNSSLTGWSLQVAPSSAAWAAAPGAPWTNSLSATLTIVVFLIALWHAWPPGAALAAVTDNDVTVREASFHAELEAILADPDLEDALLETEGADRPDTDVHVQSSRQFFDDVRNEGIDAHVSEDMDGWPVLYLSATQLVLATSALLAGNIKNVAGPLFAGLLNSARCWSFFLFQSTSDVTINVSAGAVLWVVLCLGGLAVVFCALVLFRGESWIVFKWSWFGARLVMQATVFLAPFIAFNVNPDSFSQYVAVVTLSVVAIGAGAVHRRHHVHGPPSWTNIFGQGAVVLSFVIIGVVARVCAELNGALLAGTAFVLFLVGAAGVASEVGLLTHRRRSRSNVQHRGARLLAAEGILVLLFALAGSVFVWFRWSEPDDRVCVTVWAFWLACAVGTDSLRGLRRFRKLRSLCAEAIGRACSICKCCSNSVPAPRNQASSQNREKVNSETGQQLATTYLSPYTTLDSDQSDHEPIVPTEHSQPHAEVESL